MEVAVVPAPAIFYSSGPAILLIVPGDLVLAQVPKTNMQFIVNANWDLFFDKSKKEYYLLAVKLWYSADNLKGSWAVTNILPKRYVQTAFGRELR